MARYVSRDAYEALSRLVESSSHASVEVFIFELVDLLDRIPDKTVRDSYIETFTERIQKYGALSKEEVTDSSGGGPA